MFLKGVFILVGCLLTVVETNPVKHQGWAINRTKTDKGKKNNITMYIFKKNLATKTLTAEERYEDVKISAEHHRQITTAVRNNGATCYDRRLSDIINTGLGYFSHDMGQLSKYILDQVLKSGMKCFLVSLKDPQ